MSDEANAATKVQASIRGRQSRQKTKGKKDGKPAATADKEESAKVSAEPESAAETKRPQSARRPKLTISAGGNSKKELGSSLPARPKSARERRPPTPGPGSYDPMKEKHRSSAWSFGGTKKKPASGGKAHPHQQPWAPLEKPAKTAEPGPVPDANRDVVRTQVEHKAPSWGFSRTQRDTSGAMATAAGASVGARASMRAPGIPSSPPCDTRSSLLTRATVLISVTYSHPIRATYNITASMTYCYTVAILDVRSRSLVARVPSSSSL